jgi:hypothetical protein
VRRPTWSSVGVSALELEREASEEDEKGSDNEEDECECEDAGKTKAVPTLDVLEANSTSSSDSATIFAPLSLRTILSLSRCRWMDNKLPMDPSEVKVLSISRRTMFNVECGREESVG